MIKVKSRYLYQGLVMTGLAGFAGWSLVVSSSAAPLVQADAATSSSKQVTSEQPAKPKLDPNTYARATSIRRNAALGDTELAALGLTQEQAEAVLSRVVDWCERNGAQLDEAETAYYAAQRDVMDLERKIRVGLATGQEIADIGKFRSDSSQAEVSLANLKSQVAVYAMQTPEISSGIVEVWMQARSHDHSIQGELRYLRTLNETRLRILREMAGGSKVRIEDQLTTEEKQQLQAIRQRVQTRLPGVVAAAQRVLSDPGSEGIVNDLVGLESDLDRP